VHGCFWHYHQNCRYSKIPASNSEFWKTKLEKNAKRDNEKTQLLIKSEWRVIVVWGCGIKEKNSTLQGVLFEILKNQSKCSYYEIGISALEIMTGKARNSKESINQKYNLFANFHLSLAQS
jgi:DNA mismatch endonuclease (patch repair protein)